MTFRVRSSRFRQNPSTAHATEPICFRQTVRNQEIRSKMKRRTPRYFEHRLEINLIHQNARPDLGRHRSGLRHSTIIGFWRLNVYQK